ncbi:MAG: epoxyqueuosine reductase [Clostridia bacterium]|nr:epoxyqueuosine reductase [Clostridia bacterium]
MDLRKYLMPYGIELTGVLSLSDCTVKRPYLLERAGFDITDPSRISVCIFAIPYLTPAADAPDRNLSSYAVCEDYHVFVRELAQALIPALQADFQSNRFALFADHSPIGEVKAAIDAGLGVRGKNRLLLTERYSSYVFLAELVTDLSLTPTPSPLPPELRVCHACGKCTSACPMSAEGGECRSALTQKKSPLAPDEQHTLAHFSSVWGCDICQEVCPYTARARARGTIYSPIPFFHQNVLPHLTVERLDGMNDEQFSRRAYAWRGRDTIRRNLEYHEHHTRFGKEN